jgi:hypothetical protein
MSRELQALLEAFDHLPAEEKRAFTEEVLRRSLPFDSGPLADEEIGNASDALWQSLDREWFEGKVKHSLAAAEQGQLIADDEVRAWLEKRERA